MLQNTITTKVYETRRRNTTQRLKHETKHIISFDKTRGVSLTSHCHFTDMRLCFHLHGLLIHDQYFLSLCFIDSVWIDDCQRSHQDVSLYTEAGSADESAIFI